MSYTYFQPFKTYWKLWNFKKNMDEVFTLDKSLAKQYSTFPKLNWWSDAVVKMITSPPSTHHQLGIGIMLYCIFAKPLKTVTILPNFALEILKVWDCSCTTMYKQILYCIVMHFLSNMPYPRNSVQIHRNSKRFRFMMTGSH